MAFYLRDPECKSFYWVDFTDRPVPPEGAIVNFNNRSQVLIRVFMPNPEDEVYVVTPRWVMINRPNCIAYLREQEKRLMKPAAPPAPKVLKPNPAFPILCRLSGLDEQQVKEIIGG